MVINIFSYFHVTARVPESEKIRGTVHFIDRIPRISDVGKLVRYELVKKLKSFDSNE